MDFLRDEVNDGAEASGGPLEITSQEPSSGKDGRKSKKKRKEVSDD